MSKTYSQDWESTSIGSFPATWTQTGSTGKVQAQGFEGGGDTKCLYPDQDVGAAYACSETAGDGNGGDTVATWWFEGTDAYIFQLNIRDGEYGLRCQPYGNGVNDQVTLYKGAAVLVNIEPGGHNLPINVPMQVTFTAKANVFTVRIYRADNGTYLTSTGTWSTVQDCISYTDNSTPYLLTGKIGCVWYINASNHIKIGTLSYTGIPVTATLDSYNITAPTTAQATATGFTGTTVTWSSSDQLVATVDSSGVVTPISTGTCAITATGVTNTTQTATTTTLTVTNNSPAISPPTITINQLAMTTLVAAGFTGGAVTWASSATGVATVGASSGIVTGIAHGQATNQTATITATGVADTNQTATCVVTVRAVVVSVSPSTATLGVGTTQTFTATVTGSTNTSVTWSVSSGTGSINASTGLYTAPGAAGSATILATSTADVARTGSASVVIIVATTITSIAPFGPGYKNLAGTVGVTIHSLSGATLTSVQSRATAGVVESETNVTGDYVYQFTGAAPGTMYVFLWDTGGSSPIYYTDTVQAHPNVTVGGYVTGQDPASLLLLTPANLLASDASGRVTANTTQLAGQTVTAAAGVTFPTSIASPTNITAGIITTVTNLTNLPVAPTDWLTATAVKADAVTKIQANLALANQIPADFTAATFVSAGVFSTTSLANAPTGGSAPTVVAIRQEMDSNSTKLAYLTGDTFARLGAPAGVSIAADIATRSTFAGGAVASVTNPVTLADGSITSTKFGTITAGLSGFLERLSLVTQWFFPVSGGSVTFPKSGNGTTVLKGTGATTLATSTVTDNGTTQTKEAAS